MAVAVIVTVAVAASAASAFTVTGMLSSWLKDIELMEDLEELSYLMAQSKAVDGEQSSQYLQLLYRYQAVAGKRRPRTMTAVLGERKQALKETCVPCFCTFFLYSAALVEVRFLCLHLIPTSG